MVKHSIQKGKKTKHAINVIKLLDYTAYFQKLQNTKCLLQKCIPSTLPILMHVVYGMEASCAIEPKEEDKVPFRAAVTLLRIPASIP